MRYCTPFLLISVLWCTVFGLNSVERQAPEIFSQKLEPLLTPIEEVLDGRTAFPKSEEGGIILLSERINYIEEDGTRYIARQVAYYVNEESGIDSIERDVFTFDKERMRIFLKRAFSMDENGVIKELDEDAAFIHAPQEGADNSLYTSDEELVLVYPGVRKGVVVSAIVYYVVDEPIMRNEVADNMTFASSWPIYRKRYVQDMPKEWRKRLNIVKSGTGAPKPRVTHPEKGRTRLEWVIREEDSWTYEQRAPEWIFIVPAVWISTLTSWDEVAAWYHQLSAGRDIPMNDLMEVIETATNGLSERDDIIRVLTTLASDHVRYTGLEFGMASYQPYNCNEVWKNGYGDCKDKANLLSAMLRHKGIEAWTALLNTDGHGSIEKRSPSWNQFNHAIVAVADASGSFLLIDPTVEHLVPGVLPIRDMNRPVLVLTDKGAIWTQSSNDHKSGYLMEFDLDLSSVGKLSGWCTITDFAASAAFETDSYNKRKPNARIDYAQDIINNYIPNIRVYDIDYEEHDGPVDEVSLRAYFETEGQVDTAESIQFPYPISYLPEFPARARENPYAADAYTRRVFARLKLPPKKIVQSLPEPFVAENKTISIKASWSINDQGDLVAQFTWTPRQYIIDPADLDAYKRAVFSAGAWLKQPLLLIDGDDATVSLPDKPDTVINFPLLATGEGQMRLLEDRFPDKDERRRKALNQVIQWFPDDPKTLTDAKVKLVLIDWPGTAEEAGQSIEEFSRILSEYGDQIDKSTWAWIKYLEARSRYLSGQQKEMGIQDLEGLLNDSTLSAFRRGWSGYMAALYARDIDKDRSVKLLNRVREFDSEALPDADRLLLDILMEQDNPDAIRDLLKDVISRGESADASLSSLVNGITERLNNMPESMATAIAGLVEELRNDVPGDKTAQSIEDLLAQLHARDAQAELVEAYRNAIGKLSPDWWLPAHDARTMDLDALHDAVREADGKDGVNLSTHYLLRGSNEPFDKFVFVLFYHAWWLNSMAPEGREELLDILESFIEKLPLDEEQYLPRAAGRMALAWRSMKKNERAERILNAFRNRPDLEDWMRVDLNRQLINIHLDQEQKNAVLAIAGESRDILDSNKYGTDIAFVELAILLANGKNREALDALDLLLSLNEKWLDESDYATMVKLLHSENLTTENAEVYWSHGSGWWDDWVSLCQQYGASPFKMSNVLKLRHPESWTDTLAEAYKSGQEKAYLEELGTIVVAARILPKAMIDVREAVTRSAEINADLYTALRKFFMAATENWTFGDDTTKNSIKLIRAANLHDTGSIPQASQLARELYETLGPEEVIGSSALRIWLLTERDNTRKNAAVREAESVLASGLVVANREALIKELSDAYLLREADNAQNSLFEREQAFLKKTDLSIHNLLQERLGLAVKETSLTLKVEKWIQENCSEWFAATWPGSYEEAGISPDGNIYALIPGTGAQIKMSLIAAMNEDRPLGERQQAAWLAMSYYGYHLVSSEAFLEFARDTLSDYDFPQDIRAPFWYMATSALIEREDPDSLGWLLERKYTEGVRPEIVTNVRKMRTFLQTFQSAKDSSLVDCIKHLEGVTMDNVSEGLVSNLITRLVYLDRQEDARKVLKDTKLFVARSGFTISAMRLKWMQVYKEAVGWLPFDKVYRDLVKNMVNSFPSQEPKAFRWFLPTTPGYWLDSTQVKECALYAIATGRFKGGSCTDLFDALIDPENSNDVSLLSIDLLKEALAVDSSPDLKVVRLFSLALTDIDNSEHRNALTKVLTPVVKDTKQDDPVRKACNLILSYVALRTSNEESPEALFGEFSSGQVGIEQQRLLYFLNHGRTDKLLDQVNTYVQEASIPVDGYFACYLAYEALGLDLEAELAKDAVLDAIRNQLHTDSAVENVSSWQEFPIFCWYLDAYDVLPDYSIYPVIEKSTPHRGRDIFKLHLLLYQKDWEGLLQHSSRFLQQVPDLYDIYGLQALAFAHRGQLDDAQKAMDVYTRHCRDAAEFTAIIRSFEKCISGSQSSR